MARTKEGGMREDSNDDTKKIENNRKHMKIIHDEWWINGGTREKGRKVGTVAL